MNEPELMELIRLQPGDVLADHNWTIMEVSLKPAPNQKLSTDEMGRWLNNAGPVHITRMKFTCSPGGWHGYLFPTTGEFVCVQYNGVHETVQTTGALPLTQLVHKRKLVGGVAYTTLEPRAKFTPRGN